MSACSVPDSASSKEVCDLKLQISTLTEQLSALNEQVEFLSGAMQKLQVREQGVVEESTKKRKVFIKSESLQRMNSLDSSSAYNLKDANVSGVVDFSNMVWLADEEAMDEVVPANNGDGVEELECGDDMALFGDLMAPTPREKTFFESDACCETEVKRTSLISDSSSLKSNPLPALMVPGATLPSTVPSDMSSIIDGLSPEMKSRFLDKLAESMGAHMAASFNTLSESSKLSSDSKSYTPCVPTFLLPSGSEAPEIALPLASAALGAFVQSLYTFQQQANTGTVSATKADKVVKV
jgi:hypothetical protein